MGKGKIFSKIFGVVLAFLVIGVVPNWSPVLVTEAEASPAYVIRFAHGLPADHWVAEAYQIWGDKVEEK